MLQHPDGTRELFAKPDDRWELNEVADRCAAIADELQQELLQLAQSIRSGRPTDLPPLPEALAVGVA